MDDLGAPLSYLVLEKGVPVYSSDGQRLGCWFAQLQDDVAGLAANLVGQLLHQRRRSAAGHLDLDHGPKVALTPCHLVCHDLGHAASFAGDSGDRDH